MGPFTDLCFAYVLGGHGPNLGTRLSGMTGLGRERRVKDGLHAMRGHVAPRWPWETPPRTVGKWGRNAGTPARSEAGHSLRGHQLPSARSHSGAGPSQAPGAAEPRSHTDLQCSPREQQHTDTTQPPGPQTFQSSGRNCIFKIPQDVC